MVDELTKFINDEARRFRRSLPPRLRPGTVAHVRWMLAGWHKMLRGGKFPAHMGSSGIYGVRGR